MTFARAVVIGKFLPPHRGHKLLIDTASSQSREVVVIVCAKPADPIPGELRAAWLREIHPTTQVMLIDDRYDENDTAVWAANTIRWLGGPPDAAFTSEDYGEPYARAIGCAHVLVDKPRLIVPCSGSAILRHPLALDAPPDLISRNTSRRSDPPCRADTLVCSVFLQPKGADMSVCSTWILVLRPVHPDLATAGCDSACGLR